MLHFPKSSIEPLEARIAPALLVNGANLLGGTGNPSSGQTSIGGNEVTLVKVVSGQALVWFDDGRITDISFGQNTSLELTGDILGDLIGNLAPGGRLSDSNADPFDGEDGNILLPNNLTGLKTFALGGQNGDVPNIITGGSISNVSINGKISGIYAGDGVFRAESRLLGGGSVISSVGFDINPVDPSYQSTFEFTEATSKFLAGASIKNVTVQTAKELQVFAGNGDADGVNATLAGAAGGSIEKITIQSAFIDPSSSGDTPSYFLRAGDGENGKSGGAGGSVATIIEKTSNGTVIVMAGNGGNGADAAGGAGGSVRGLEMQSDSSNYTVVAGKGGTGVGGGAGGSAVNNNFANRTPTNSILITEDFTGDGLEDVLVIDSSSGQMVLSRNVDNGADFPKVIQTTTEDGDPVVAIAALGTTPSDALTMDFDGDNDLDVVVAYKNSNSLAVYLNDGLGRFWDPVESQVAGFTASLGFSPALISRDSGGTSLALISHESGKSVVHRVFRSDTFAYTVMEKVTKLDRLATDLVLADSDASGTFLYAGAQDGSILRLAQTGSDDLPPYEVISTGARITGGVANLDVDGSGSRMLALSAGSKTMSVFDIGSDGTLTIAGAPSLSSSSGRPVLARFVDDLAGERDSIAVLSVLPVGSRLDLYDAIDPAEGEVPLPTDPAFTLAASLAAQPTLKNFSFAFGTSQPGVAAVGGSLSQFFYSRTLADLAEYALPFVGKKVIISGGNGGDGFDNAKVFGKGGDGGGISGLNAEAIEIELRAGDAGDSVNGAGGAGGSVSNPATFTSALGAIIAPALIAEERLEITVGDGGAPAGVGSKSAAGGAGGSISGLSLTLATGEGKLFTGEGGDGKGGAGGNGGNVNGVTLKTLDGSLTLTTGSGGDAASGKVKAGSGGAVSNFKFILELTKEVEKLENGYFVAIMTGGGGNAPEGLGGAGGALANVALTLDGADTTYNDPSKAPPLVDSKRDSTISISLITGDGGDGATGGAGGGVSGLSSVSVFDQKTPENSIIPNFVVMNIVAGHGGDSGAGIGANGGGISFAPAGLAGITHYDPVYFDGTPGFALPADNPDGIPLRVTAGNGGNGSTKGGVGGSIAGLVAKNTIFVTGEVISHTHLAGAGLTAGNGGAGGTLDGGKGGDVTKAMIGVEDGALFVTSGNGGAGGGKGGAGGAISSSTFGAVNQGLALMTGNGGAGVKGGGAGGLMTLLDISAPQQSSGPSAFLLTGDGGAATGPGAIGGAGGDISKISQAKDINSAINLIEAGNGGESAAGTGGRGGNVTALKTVGFIGKPSFNDGIASGRLGAFDDGGRVQGLFAGRGGDGAVAGLAGMVSGVSARQIAAIAAAVDPATGLFAAASKVSNVKADVIGYDVDGDRLFDNVPGNGLAPSDAIAIDGFIMARAALVNVIGQRDGFIFIG